MENWFISLLMGNSTKRLETSNLATIFCGIAFGVVLGMLPIAILGLSQAFKLGLAGGTLTVAILLGHFGPKMHIVTYMTSSEPNDRQDRDSIAGSTTDPPALAYRPHKLKSTAEPL